MLLLWKTEWHWNSFRKICNLQQEMALFLVKLTLLKGNQISPLDAPLFPSSSCSWAWACADSLPNILVICSWDATASVFSSTTAKSSCEAKNGPTRGLTCDRIVQPRFQPFSHFYIRLLSETCGKSPQTKLFCGFSVKNLLMYGKQDSTILTPGPKAMLIGLHMIYFFRDSY